MKKFALIVFAAALLLAGCKGKSSQTEMPDITSDMVMADMVNIDEIEECEAILADSSLMNGTGEKAWNQKDSGLIRIKNGDKYYLRMNTKEGNVTAVTYRYIDE